MKFKQNQSQIRSEISGNNYHLIALSSESFEIPLKNVITPEQSTEFLAYLHSSLFQANAHSPVETEVNALVKANVSAPKVTKETSVQSVSTPTQSVWVWDNESGGCGLVLHNFCAYCMLPGHHS